MGEVGHFEVELSTGQKVEESGVEEDGANWRDRVFTSYSVNLKVEEEKLAAPVLRAPEERRGQGEQNETEEVHMQGQGNLENRQLRKGGKDQWKEIKESAD